MLDTSVLSELTPAACAAVTGRQDAAALLHGIDAANLFLVADEERSSFRYHHLVRQLLRAELRARDPAREQELQLRAAARHAMSGQLTEAVADALTARAIQERIQLADEWATAIISPILMRASAYLEDFQAVEREAAAALAMSGRTEQFRQVVVPGSRAVAWFEAGQLAQAAQAAESAWTQARRLGFDQHDFALDYLHALAGLALERRDLDAAEQLTEQALSISERRRPAYEFVALLDRAEIWAARGQVREALAAVEAARLVLAGTGSVLLARAHELEALLRLSLGDRRTPAELAGRLPAAPRGLLLAQIALAAGDHHAARRHLQDPSLADVTPRRALVRQLLLAAAAIERGDPKAASLAAGVLQAARLGGFRNTVVTTSPQLTSYLVEHSPQLRPDPFTERLIAAALQVRAAQPGTSLAGGLAEPLTAAELRVLKLLPTSTYLQIADTLYISRNTVKVHLRAVYQKLGATSRSQAIERAADLRLL